MAAWLHLTFVFGVYEFAVGRPLLDTHYNSDSCWYQLILRFKKIFKSCNEHLKHNASPYKNNPTEYNIQLKQLH